MASPISFSVDPRDYVDATGDVRPQVFDGPVMFTSYNPTLPSGLNEVTLWPTSLVELTDGVAQGFRVCLINDPHLARKLIMKHFPHGVSEHMHIALFENADHHTRGMVLYLVNQDQVTLSNAMYLVDHDADFLSLTRMVAGLSTFFDTLPEDNFVLSKILEGDGLGADLGVGDDDFDQKVDLALSLGTERGLARITDSGRTMISPIFQGELSQHILQLKTAFDLGLLLPIFGAAIVEHGSWIGSLNEFVTSSVGPNDPQQDWLNMIEGMSRTPRTINMMYHLPGLVQIFTNLQNLYHRVMTQPIGMVVPRGGQASATVTTELAAYPHPESATLLNNLGLHSTTINLIGRKLSSGGLSGNLFVDQASLATVLHHLEEARHLSLHDHVKGQLGEIQGEIAEIARGR